MSLNRDDISDRLAAVGYIADRDLATALWLMDFLKRPLLLEGEAGVGKTEVAKALAAVHGAELIRLQCYEGLDQNAALYEWNYQRQLLAIKTREGAGENADAIEEHIFSERYLLERPLLAAIRREKPPVLLVDEVDRADEEFEAFLLELLSDFQVSIPELGTIKATSIPRVVLTSNGTRELSDALRRRCLYHYVDFPDVDREAKIIITRTPGIDTALALQIARMVASVRKEDLRKVPGVAETLDWAATLAGLDVHDLRQEPEAVHETMMCLLKTHEDRSRLTREVTRAAARQGGLSEPRRRSDAQSRRVSTSGDERIGAPARRRLAGFARTLRDNGFKVGLAETRDALAILAAPLAARPSIAEAGAALAVLRDAFRLGALRRDLRRLLAGPRHSSGAHACRVRRCESRAPARHLKDVGPRAGTPGLPDHVERRNDGGDSPGDGRGRREGASRFENLASTDLRHIVDPDDIAQAHALAARLARVMRARLVRRERVRRRGRRLDLRRTIHRNVSHGGTLVDLAWRRRKIKPLRLVVLLDASGSMSLYTAFFVRFLHGVVDAFREVRSLRLPYPARPCVAVAARPRRHARGRQTVADGAGHRRRHARSARASPRSIAGTRGA